MAVFRAAPLTAAPPASTGRSPLQARNDARKLVVVEALAAQVLGGEQHIDSIWLQAEHQRHCLAPVMLCQGELRYLSAGIDPAAKISRHRLPRKSLEHVMRIAQPLIRVVRWWWRRRGSGVGHRPTVPPVRCRWEQPLVGGTLLLYMQLVGEEPMAPQRALS